MTKKSFILLIAIFSMVMVCGNIFAEEDDEGLQPYTLSAAINPFAIIFSYYGAEVGIPVMGFLEPTFYLNYADMFGFLRIFSADLEIPEGNSFWYINTGVSLRFFPSKKYDAFFAGFRITYIYLNVEIEGIDVIEEYLEGANSDIAVGFDLGWRWRWSFAGNIGMFVQTLVGMERYILNDGITKTLGFGVLPITPIYSLQIGFTF